MEVKGVNRIYLIAITVTFECKVLGLALLRVI
jgi:hypothetical protein